MCESIDGDLGMFENSIRALQNGPRTYAAHIEEGEVAPDNPGARGYELRRDVCEKSRFVWFSTSQALNGYGTDLLRRPGLTPEPRAQRVDRLFREAVDLLSEQNDRFLLNVRARAEELAPVLAPILDELLSGTATTSQ